MLVPALTLEPALTPIITLTLMLELKLQLAHTFKHLHVAFYLCHHFHAAFMFVCTSRTPGTLTFSKNGEDAYVTSEGIKGHEWFPAVCLDYERESISTEIITVQQNGPGDEAGGEELMAVEAGTSSKVPLEDIGQWVHLLGNGR